MVNDMKEKINFRKILPLLIAAAVFLFADLFCTGAMLLFYPQFAVEGEVLIGENGSNLKEFEISDTGTLISMSDDPWIYYVFGEPVNVRFLTVETSKVAGPESDMQLYLMPSAGYRMTELKNGTTTVQFGVSQGCIGVGGIRLDLATEKDVTVSAERVVVNSRGVVILDAQRSMLRLCFLLAVIALELLGWRRLAEKKKEAAERAGICWKPTFLGIAAALQLMLKLGLLLILRKPLIDKSGTDQNHLLCVLLVTALEAFCIMALHFGASSGKEKKKANIWYGYLLILPLAFVYFSLVEFLTILPFDFQSVEYLCLNLWLCALVPAGFLLVIRWESFALSASAILFTVWTVANHYYGILRDNPLEYFDMANAKTAVNVVGNYTLALDVQAGSAFMAAAVIVIVLAVSFGKKGCGYRGKEIAGNFVLVAAMAAIFYVRIPSFYNFSNLQVISMEKGYLLSFVSFIKMGQIRQPEGYTPELADEILEKADQERLIENSQIKTERMPNVIVIMDEAFADLPSIYGFETDQDVLPNIHALSENTIHGKLLVSVYGGGTANTEYEFLTGNSLHFLPMGCSPYVQYVGSHQQSLAWKLENLGYSAAAYHPYLAISYRRPEAYSHLGLAEFYSIEDELPYDKNLRTYVSDDADFKNVIHLYEQREQGKPFFLFNVTMQNHGGYSTDQPGVEVAVMPTAEELQETSFLEYLNLIHATDTAFQQLIDYFSEVEEDTIILMFGDHQPSTDQEINETLDQFLLAQDGGLKEERRYYSTFVMWANFDIDEADDMITSPNYLRSLLLSQAGLELNAYEQFLMKLREEYPALNAFGYLDSQGEWHSRDDASEGGLREYRYLMYQNVFDKKHVNEKYYE